MDQLNLKLLMELLQDIIDYTNKVKKLQLIVLLVFMHGHKVYGTEEDLMVTKSSKNGVRI